MTWSSAGATNSSVSIIVVPSSMWLTAFQQELMKNGDTKDYVETGKFASVMMDRFVCRSSS